MPKNSQTTVTCQMFDIKRHCSVGCIYGTLFNIISYFNVLKNEDQKSNCDFPIYLNKFLI